MVAIETMLDMLPEEPLQGQGEGEEATGSEVDSNATDSEEGSDSEAF